MELKHDETQNIKQGDICINRTSVELKRLIWRYKDLIQQSINRTSVELKRVWEDDKTEYRDGINRTSVELKQFYKTGIGQDMREY